MTHKKWLKTLKDFSTPIDRSKPFWELNLNPITMMKSRVRHMDKYGRPYKKIYKVK